MENEIMTDAFQEAQDQRMEGLAKDVLDKKTVSAEQSAEILGWLVLNFLTMKRSLWSESKLADKIRAAIDAHKEACDAEDGSADGISSKKNVIRMVCSYLFSEKGFIVLLIAILGVMLYAVITILGAVNNVHFGDEANRYRPASSSQPQQSK